jgi:Histone lysine methyltransferase SET associated
MINQRLKASQGLVTNPRDYGPRNPGSGSYMASSPPTRLNLNSNTFSLTSTPTTPTSSISSGLKRQASNTAMASSSTIAPALRARDRDDPYLDAPIGPRADRLVEREPIRPQLANDPHIFILGGEIRVSGENIHHMQAMLSSARFSPTVRADRTGFFLIFRHSAEGEREAADCFHRFNGRQFTGIPMEMELRRRDGSRISSN